MSAENTNAGGTAIAEAEYARWGTGMDTRRPRGEQAWVCRQNDAGEWIETTAHRHDGEADEARHKQALAAAVDAALSAYSTGSAGVAAEPVAASDGDEIDAGYIGGAAMQVIGTIAEAAGFWGRPEIEAALKYFGGEGWAKGQEILPFVMAEHVEPVAWRTDILNLCNSVIGDAFLGYKAECDLAQKVKAAMLAAAPTPPAGGGETNTETTGVAPHSSVQSVTGEAAFKSCAVDTVTLAKDAPFYQFREMGEGEGWQFCSKAVYDSFQSDPRMDTREVPASQVRPAAHSPASPAGGGETATWLDQPLPEDVDLGGCIFRKGVRIGVLVNAARRHYQNAKRAFVESRELTAAPSPASPAGDLVSLSAGGFGLLLQDILRQFARDVEASPVWPGMSVEEFNPRFEAMRDASGAIMAAASRLAPAAPRKGPSRDELAEAFYAASNRILGPRMFEGWEPLPLAEDPAAHEAHYAYADAALALLTPADRGETQAVGDGWQLVPVEPTEDMLDAGKEAIWSYHQPQYVPSAETCGLRITLWPGGCETTGMLAYRAMIAASPTPDQNRGEPDQGGANTEAGR